MNLLTEFMGETKSTIKGPLVRVLLALVILSLANGLLVLLVGPLLKGILTSGSVVGLSDLLPAKFHRLFPQAWDQTWPVQVLALWLPGLIIAVGLLKSLATYVYQVNQNHAALLVAAAYRRKLFERIMGLPFQAIQAKAPGQWMSVLINDVHLLQMRFSDLTTGLLRDVFTVCSALIALSLVHAPSALVLAILTPLMAYGMGRAGQRIAFFAALWQRELALMVESVLSIRRRFDFIRAQGGESLELKWFDAKNHAYYQNIKKSLLIRSGFAPWVEFLCILIFVSIVYGTGTGWLFKHLSVPQLFQVFAAFGLILRPLRNMGEQIANFQETRGALRESLALFTLAAQRQVPQLATSLQRAGSIASKNITALPDNFSATFTSLSVGYNGQAVAKFCDLKIARGKSIAIIGPSGAGKSTLIKTFANLLDAIESESDVTLATLAPYSSYVSQRPYLFDGDLRSNISYGCSSISDSVIWSALTVVGLEPLLRSDPRGLDRPIKGLTPEFSGGQIQRIVVARLLVQDRLLWLLDEATSAVDQKTEQELTQALLQLTRAENRMLLMVTHRLRWLLHYDEVWFVDGSLQLKGTHEQLLQNPHYNQFVAQTTANLDMR